MTRRKFTSKFKTKVVLEALKERQTVKELAQKFEITPQQINTWKREFLKDADAVFFQRRKVKKIRRTGKERPASQGHWELKVENDFLKNALR